MDRYKISGIKIFRFIFGHIKSNMYVVIEDREALIIDPHISVKACSFLKGCGIEKVIVLFTHEHPDHTCGIKHLMKVFSGIVICQKKCAESISDRNNNRPVLISFILSKRDKIDGTNTAKEFSDVFELYSCKTDISFEQEFYYKWHNYKLFFKATPGHSKGSCCIILNNRVIFTGDSLILNSPVITRFPGGSMSDYENSTRPFLKSLDKNLIVLPGHGDIFKIKDAV
jgi:glyoxylase-like metal-dependent hydrolase (beta-lactamase superfamily II)